MPVVPKCGPLLYDCCPASMGVLQTCGCNFQCTNYNPYSNSIGTAPHVTGTCIDCASTNQNTSIWAALRDFSPQNMTFLDVSYNNAITPIPANFTSYSFGNQLLVFRMRNVTTLVTLPCNFFNTFTNLLTTIHLAFNAITDIPCNLFNYCTSLYSLYWFNSYIFSLPPNLFDFTPSLTEVYLDSNTITVIPAGLFNFTPSLTTLWLNSNNITAIPAGLFDFTPSLTEVYLYSNTITAIPSGLFNFTPSLTTFWLNYNNITAIPAGLFDFTSSLTEVYLNSNNITAIPAGLFNFTPILGIVTFVYNAITELPINLLDFCGSTLYDFDISYNKLTRIPKDFFKFASQLQTLELDNNRLGTLPAGLFNFTTQLKSITLQKNNIISLPEALFTYAVQLTVLNLAFNGITSITDSLLDGSTKLQYLMLCVNNLTNFGPNSLATLSSLLYLNVAFNQLVKLPPISAVSSLKMLIANDNFIAEVPSNFVMGLFKSLAFIFMINNPSECRSKLVVPETNSKNQSNSSSASTLLVFCNCAPNYFGISFCSPFQSEAALDLLANSFISSNITSGVLTAAIPLNLSGGVSISAAAVDDQLSLVALPRAVKLLQINTFISYTAYLQQLTSNSTLFYTGSTFSPQYDGARNGNTFSLYEPFQKITRDGSVFNIQLSMIYSVFFLKFNTETRRFIRSGAKNIQQRIVLGGTLSSAVDYCYEVLTDAPISRTSLVDTDTASFGLLGNGLLPTNVTYRYTSIDNVAGPPMQFPSGIRALDYFKFRDCAVLQGDPNPADFHSWSSFNLTFYIYAIDLTTLEYIQAAKYSLVIYDCPQIPDSLVDVYKCHGGLCLDNGNPQDGTLLLLGFDSNTFLLAFSRLSKIISTLHFLMMFGSYL